MTIFTRTLELSRGGALMEAFLAPLKTLGALLLLAGYLKMRHVEQQPHKHSAVVHVADDLEHGRHKHDGSQPTVDHARPGQERSVQWHARL